MVAAKTSNRHAKRAPRRWSRVSWLILLLGLGWPLAGYAQDEHEPPPPPYDKNAPQVQYPVETVMPLSDNDFTVRHVGNVDVYLYQPDSTKLTGKHELEFTGSSSSGDISYPITTHIMTGTLVAGKQEGRWRTHFDPYAAKPRFGDETTTYVHGIRHGPFLALGPGGKVRYRTAFTNGTGYFKRYYASGQLCSEVLYYHNERHGWNLVYETDGFLSEEKLYQRGQVQQVIRHYRGDVR